jgi:hypothetical protein
VRATKDQIGARVDALAQAHEGDEFVTAVRHLADELGPEGQPVLQEVLLDRAAEEEHFKKALRQRNRGWTRRTLAKLEGLWRDDRADAVAEAVEAGSDGEEVLAAELDLLRKDRGRAAVVFDALSRHRSRRVRAWVPGAAADVLGDGGDRLILSMTRNRDREVRDAAVTALIGLGPETAWVLVPDLRRRLHSPDVDERIAAMWALAELGDSSSLEVIDGRAEAAELPEERSAARAAALVVRGDEAAVIAGLRADDDHDLPALAAAARILGTEATLDALERAATDA